MTTKFHLTFLLITALGLVSCASYKGFPDRVINTDTELGYLKDYFLPKKVDEYNKAGVDEAKRQRIRNEIINGRLAAIDIQFSLFQKNLHEDGLNLNIGSDAIVLGLGAAGALASGGTSQVLSATSAAVTGLNGSINKNAFYEQTMPALFAQMIAQRKKVLAKIRTGLASNSSDYPLQQGFVDIEDYQYAGSIPGSLATIVEDAGVTSAKATQTLDKILEFKMDQGALGIEEYLGPPDTTGNFDPVKVQKIKTCWKKTDVPDNTLLVDFVFEEMFAAKREEVLVCVNKLQ